ncbi:MAG: HDOD domain-containing protein [Candidatus Latescibacterota bacterium]|jgi:HD-like signal output (HDOD) protein
MFAAGLLHDIGKVLMVEYFTEEINEAYAQAYAQDCSIAKVETDVLGISHADDGLHAGIEWQFSVLLVNVIGRHQLAIRPDSAAPKDQTGTLSAARNTHRRRGQLRPRLRHAALGWTPSQIARRIL